MKSCEREVDWKDVHLFFTSWIDLKGSCLVYVKASCEKEVGKSIGRFRPIQTDSCKVHLCRYFIVDNERLSRMSLIDTCAEDALEVAPGVERIPSQGDLLIPTPTTDTDVQAAATEEETLAPEEEEHTYSKEVSDIIDDFDPLANAEQANMEQAEEKSAIGDLKGIKMN
eukprot:CFRG5312T1